MAEVLGLAASIIQVAGAGAKLSVALYNFTNSAARADQDIKDIADDVELTSNALESVGKVFESEDAKSIVSKKAIQDANNIIKKCQGVFDEVSEMVEKRMRIGKDGKKSLSMMGKLAWPMKEQRVELNRRRLESLKNSLMLLFHVLQLAKGQSQGMMDKSIMEEERVKVREWHQREQDSLKIQRAVESRFCDLILDDKGTLQGSMIASRVVTSELMVNTQAMNLPPLEQHSKIQANTITIDLSTVDDSDTSDSNATMTDDENEDHISTEELSRAADHVKGLLKRITVLQKSLATNQKTHRKRHVRKMYQRFCRKFESGINAAQASVPSPTGKTNSVTTFPAYASHYPRTAAPGVAPQQQAAMQQQSSQQLAPAPAMNGDPALAPLDYQLQLILLEQQNTKRLLIARQEQDNKSQSTIESQPQDYQLQLMLLEQQNKERLRLARQEQVDKSQPTTDSARTARANDEAAMGVHSKPHKSAKRGSVGPQKRKSGIRTKSSYGERRSMVVPSTQKPQSTGFVSDEEEEGDEEAGHRVRTKKRRTIREADDDLTEAEGDLELVNGIVADTSAGHGKERELVETESALDLTDRDIVDVLLEQWTVPVC